jgi:hypothetical protein
MSLGITNRASTSTLYIRAFQPLAALRSSRAFCTSRLLPRRSLRATTKHDQHTTPSRHYCTKADACAYCTSHSKPLLHAYKRSLWELLIIDVYSYFLPIKHFASVVEASLHFCQVLRQSIGASSAVHFTTALSSLPPPPTRELSSLTSRF